MEGEKGIGIGRRLSTPHRVQGSGEDEEGQVTHLELLVPLLDVVVDVILKEERERE